MYKLMVVDDESESRNTLCNCFPWQEIGFEIVAQADNGKEALSYIKNNVIDVILCDIKMPLMSGIDLAKEVYGWPSKPIIIFLSGYRDFEFAQKALAFGVRYYIVKPARYEEVMNLFQLLKQELDAKYGTEKLALIQEFHSKNANAASFQDQLIKTIQKYIEENYREANLESASKLIHMNSSYLSQLFKQKTGINFSDYLITVKMKKAAELLMDYSMRTYSISEMVGYTNAKNFARTFKNFYGLNPREYRNAHLAEALPKAAANQGPIKAKEDTSWSENIS